MNSQSSQNHRVARASTLARGLSHFTTRARVLARATPIVALLATFGQASAQDSPELLRQNATTQPAAQTQPATTQAAAPDLLPLLSKPQPEMWAVTQRYEADRGNLNRFFTVVFSPQREARLRLFYADWLTALNALKTDNWSDEGKSQRDWLKQTIQSELSKLDTEATEFAQAAPLLPFAHTIIELGEARLRMEPVDGQKSAAALHELRHRDIAHVMVLNAAQQIIEYALAH